MNNKIEDARTDLEAALAHLASAQERSSHARAELDSATGAERAAHTRVSVARQNLASVEAEPRAAAELEGVVDRLRLRLASAPAKSPTAAEVRDELAKLHKLPTAVARLDRARGLSEILADSYQRDRQAWDSIESRTHADRLSRGVSNAKPETPTPTPGTGFAH